MDIKVALLKEHSKAQTIRIADYIGSDPEKFAELMALFQDKTYRVTQRAAWPLGVCAERHPELIVPYLETLIKNLNKDVNVAVKRNTVRALQFIDLPDDLLGLAADNCFKLLVSNEEPVAVKAFAMTVLANICKKEPDLAHELKLVIEDQMPYGSAGFKSRGKKVLKQLTRIENLS